MLHRAILQRSQSKLVALTSTALLLTACGRSHRAPGPSDASVDVDVGVDMDGAKPEPEPVPTTLTLVNAGSAPMVIGDQCGGHFLSLTHDGDALPYNRSWFCSCDAPDVCSSPVRCLSTEKLLVPGQQSTLEWDGLWMRYDEPSCYELAGLERDDTVTAEACGHVGTVDEPSFCTRADFAYDTDRNVTIEAMPISAARKEITVVLDNQSGAAIDIVTDRCGAQDWFHLALPSGDASLAQFCPCECDADFKPTDCPVCGGCAEDVTQSVASGSSATLTWDGMFWHSYESGCAMRYAMPTGYTVQAEVCFKKANATLPTCQPVMFVHGQQTEVHVVVE
jgi:hypothetical protein